MSITPIVIDSNTEKTCVNFYGLCYREAVPENPVIRIRRAGKPTHLLEYPGTVDADTGLVCFTWGPLMWELPSGRYIGDLFDGGQIVGFIQFQVNPQQWRAETYKAPEPKPTVPCTDTCD